MGSMESQTAAALQANKIDVDCPKCSHKNTKTLGWLRANRLLTCAGCGEDITLDTAGLEAGYQSALREARKLDETLSKTIKLNLKL